MEHLLLVTWTPKDIRVYLFKRLTSMFTYWLPWFFIKIKINNFMYSLKKIFDWIDKILVLSALKLFLETKEIYLVKSTKTIHHIIPSKKQMQNFCSVHSAQFFYLFFCRFIVSWLHYAQILQCTIFLQNNWAKFTFSIIIPNIFLSIFLNKFCIVQMNKNVLESIEIFVWIK